MTPDRVSSAPPVPHLPVLPTGPVRWWTAGTSVALASLLSLGAYAGTPFVAAAALLGVVVLAWGWPALLDLPSPRGTTSLVALGGALSSVAVALTDQEPLLQWLSLALAGSVVGEFLHQLLRRDGRPRMVESVSGSVAGVVVLASMAALVALPRSPLGADGVLVGAVPVAIGLAVQALPLPARLCLPLGSLLATAVGGLLGGLLVAPTVVAGGTAALLGSGVALMLHRLLAVLPPAGWAPGWLALAVAPLASSGMVAYVVLRLLVA